MKITRQGTFGKKEIYYELVKSKLNYSRGLVIFFHGCCSSSFGNKKTNAQLMADKLSESGYDVGLFETSRNLRKIDIKDINKLNFFEFINKSFGGKFLSDELKDVNIVVEKITFLYENQKKTKSLDIHYIGFSLGGLMSLLVSSKFVPETITMFGSAISFNIEKENPLLGKGISKLIIEKIKYSAKRYLGNILIVRGTEDEVAQKKQTLELYNLFKNAKSKEIIEFLGVGHRFKCRFGKNDKLIIQEMVEIFLKKVS